MGGALDTGMIAVLSYAMYQAAIDNLRSAGASSTITDLDSDRTRPLTGVEIAANMTDMFLTKVDGIIGPSWLTYHSFYLARM